MKAWPIVLLLACGQRDVRIVKIESEMALSDAAKAKCPRLPQYVDQIKAKLIVEGMEGTPCPLTVSLSSTSSDTLQVAGECAGIPIGGRPLFKLVWYALSPTKNKEIELAESLGRAPLEAPEEKFVDIEFDPEKIASLQPHTKASATDTPATRDQYNCDRTGTNVCDSMNPAPASAGTDVDTCSNLEELCQQTLFTNSVDQCPPGPLTN